MDTWLAESRVCTALCYLNWKSVAFALTRADMHGLEEGMALWLHACAHMASMQTSLGASDTLSRVANAVIGTRHVCLHLCQRLHPDWQLCVLRDVELVSGKFAPYTRRETQCAKVRWT